MKFQINLDKVSEMFDTNKIPFRGNEHLLRKVAFDLFRVDGDETDDLWQVQADDDGVEFLVRTFSVGDEKVSKGSDWSVLADKKYNNLTVAFQGIPITRLACKDYGVDDGKTFQGIVFNKLSSDIGFAIRLIASLPKEKVFALKQAGLLEKMKDWIESKDITDPIIKEIKEIVDDEEIENPEEEDFEEEDQWSLAFLNMRLMKKSHCGECGQDAEDFDSIFNKIHDKYLKEYNVESMDKLPEEVRAEMFEEVDKAWPHEL